EEAGGAPARHLSSFGEEAVGFSSQLTMLGCIFDERLTWVPHVAAVCSRALAALNANAILLGAKMGFSMSSAWAILEATVMTRLGWDASLKWECERGGVKLKMLERVQKEVARLICGGFKSASRAAMEVEAGFCRSPTASTLPSPS
ncbi:hypothetical protein JCM10213_002261, partial [Rhodosporidiobolus nylandii]